MKTIFLCIIATIAFTGFLFLVTQKDPIENKANVVQLETKKVMHEEEAQPKEKTVSEVPTEAPLPAFNTETLAQYNDADSSLPIYIAFDGDVYDVTLGRSYYEPGGAYAFLAGTDGTELLSVIGGDIIKKKYPVIGTFTP